MDYILTYDGNTANVLSNGFMFVSTDKPVLPFDFDVLIYETPTKNSYKVLDDDKLTLTAEEIVACNIYCSEYSVKNDYLVSAYDSYNVYMSDMLKSEAEAKGYSYVLFDTPESTTVKRVNDMWVPIYCVIKDDGSYIYEPSYICSTCVIFFTAEEWEAFPSKPLRPTDTFNFVTEVFEDKRVYSTVEYMAETDIRNYFEALRWQVWDKFIPQYEQNTWSTQVSEAESWFRDSTAITLYTDVYLASLEGETISKEDFLLDVLNNHKNYTVKMANINAQQKFWLNKVKNASTLDELDVIIKDIEEAQNTLSDNRPLIGG